MLPCLNSIVPQTKGPRGATSELCEINGLATNSQSNHLYTAAGDNCCYAWDLQTQTCIGKMSGHTDYLHSVTVLPRSQLGITGSEDGSMGIWDLRTFKNVGFCSSAPSSNTLTSKGGANASPPPSGTFVSSVAADESESWVVCGGGADGPRGKVTGQLSTWYLPSRSMTSSIQSPAAVQNAVLHEDEIVSVGSEPVIRHWNRHSGELRTKTRSTPPSIFAVNINPVQEYQVRI
jgi:WD40 repeat protein